VNLDSLLEDYWGLDDAQMQARAISIYQACYITSGAYGLHPTHDNDTVVFWSDRFAHAFFNKDKAAHFYGAKKVLDVERIERIRWIGEVVRGNVPNSVCWEVPSPEGRLRPPNRLYIVNGRNYVVFLEPRMEGGGSFLVLIPRRYIKCGAIQVVAKEYGNIDKEMPRD